MQSLYTIPDNVYEQNPQSTRRNNFPGGQISRWFLLHSKNLSASNYPGAAHGDAGDQAASGNSSTSISGYQRLNTVPSSRLSVLTRVCNSRCAPRLLHCICCFLQKRLLTTWFTVDSTKPVAIASPL